jgi:Sodium/hydrogen exchanger family
MTLLGSTAVFLAATVMAVPLCRKLGLGSVLGYLLAGIVPGPWGPRIVSDVERVLRISEFDIVLLLFVIGLELQPTRLRAMRKAVFGLGLTQVMVTSIVFGLIARWFGLRVNESIIVGLALSLSSTPASGVLVRSSRVSCDAQGALYGAGSRRGAGGVRPPVRQQGSTMEMLRAATYSKPRAQRVQRSSSWPSTTSISPYAQPPWCSGTSASEAAGRCPQATARNPVDGHRRALHQP